MKKKTMKSTKINGLPWILPAFIFVVGIIYYSIFYTFNLSTLDWNGLDPIRTSVGVDNFVKVFHDPIFWKAITNTVIYFMITFLVQNSLGFIFAAILHTEVKFPTIHKCLIFIPTIIAPATMAPVFRLLFSPQGMLQDFFNKFHINLTVDWLSKPNSALFILMIIAIWEFTGMSFILYYATEFLGTYIYRQGIRQSHLGYAAAISVLLLVLAICGALLTNRANKGDD